MWWVSTQAQVYKLVTMTKLWNMSHQNSKYCQTVWVYTFFILPNIFILILFLLQNISVKNYTKYKNIIRYIMNDTKFLQTLCQISSKEKFSSVNELINASNNFNRTICKAPTKDNWIKKSMDESLLETFLQFANSAYPILHEGKNFLWKNECHRFDQQIDKKGSKNTKSKSWFIFLILNNM